ncbi:DUF4149 domain-containing protein [Rivibacter subsaxonicus]|uniref:Uncharacterized protein DUF4149 n=1 Tax=Rivibacter subsaxonicus TaxID=457575 RepID=A0A4Q7VNT0_9BURK|nr:DUF4149 domain-containing protein [Rivibacter subsaxonicus]RZT98033.1 uncharacterized protein DUF4149 [Rivibacter subsaxonicus]
MSASLQARLRILVPGLWAGILLCVGLIAAPAPFATLQPADAGRVVARVFAQEAYLSLALSVLLYFVERRRARAMAAAGTGSVFSVELGLVLGALFCTVAGYFALQPMLQAARAGQGAFSFATLHMASAGLFGLKALLVLALAWRVARRDSLD